MGLFGKHPNYAKRAERLVGMGSVAGTMLLTSHDEKLTKIFLACMRDELQESWTKLIAVAAAGHAYLCSPEARAGERAAPDRPILAATSNALAQWRPGLDKLLAEYFHFLEHFRRAGTSSAPALNAAFVSYHFQHHPAFPDDLRTTVDDPEVMNMVGGMIVSQFGNYW